MSLPALERCVGDVQRFAEEHWGRRPLLHRGEADAFAGLLELTDVDRLITETLLRMPAFRLVKDGETIDASSYTQAIRIGGKPVERTVRPDRVADAFADGATIVLQALHRQSGEIGRLCRGFELALTHPVQANAYVTPPSSQGFAVHHDTHDVFVIQTHGSKAWRVYDAGAPIVEAELTPGDVLYIPRGFPHDADARAGVSAHVTVGILSSTWVDVWRSAMKRLSERRSFREPLPIGFADDPEALSSELEVRKKELHDWIDEVIEPGMLEDFADEFWRARRPLSSGRIAQLESIDGIKADTRVRRRPEGVFRVGVNEHQASVLLGLRELRLPRHCEAALQFVAESTDWFAATDVPGLADDASRVVLIRRLAREGALEVEGAGD